MTIVIEYVHHGESNIRTFSYQQYEDKYEWTFDGKDIHCGDERTLNTIISTIGHNGSILNTLSME